MIGKAVARVVRNTPLATGVFDALVDMFPTGDLPAARGVGPTSPEVREQLVACARKLLARWPSRAAPGPNGSRFEHWGAVTQDEDSWEAAAQVVVPWASAAVIVWRPTLVLGFLRCESLMVNCDLLLVALCCGVWLPGLCACTTRRTSGRPVANTSSLWVGTLVVSWFTKPSLRSRALLPKMWCSSSIAATLSALCLASLSWMLSSSGLLV